MRLLLSALLLAFAFSAQIHAQEWPQDDYKEPSEIPDILKPLEEQGAQIRFLGNYAGFNGWIIFNKGQPSYTYTSENGRLFFQGMMFGPKGENITLQQLKEFRLRGAGSSFDTLNEVSRLLLEKQRQEERVNAAEQIADRIERQTPSQTRQPAANNTTNADPVRSAQTNQTAAPAQQAPAAARDANSKAERLMSDFEHSNWVSLGNYDAPEIYAMIDPNCPHCRKAMQGFKSYLDSGRLEIRMVPIAFEDRAKRVGALLLAAGDPKQAFYEYISGNLPNLGNDTGVNTQGVERNIMTAVAWGFNVTPMFFYRNAAGEVKIIKGVPKDYDLILKDIYG